MAWFGDDSGYRTQPTDTCGWKATKMLEVRPIMVLSCSSSVLSNNQVIKFRSAGLCSGVRSIVSKLKLAPNPSGLRLRTLLVP